jgi:hypothetical protein
MKDRKIERVWIINYLRLDNNKQTKNSIDKITISFPMTKTRSIALWIFLTSIFSWLMFRIIFPYSSWEWDVDFLQTKQFIIHLDHYRISFYAHIFSSLVILVSGSFLFVDALLKNWPSAHRTLGKLYVALLLLVAAPSGFVMAFYANGGWMAKTSFLILTPLWW